MSIKKNMKTYTYQCYTYELFFNKPKEDVLNLLLKNDDSSIKIYDTYKQKNLYIVAMGIEKTTDPILYQWPKNYDEYDNIEPLMLWENQELYWKVFLLLDFSVYALNGEVLTYVFRTGREIAKSSLEKACYWIFQNKCEINCLASKKPLEEYLKGTNRKINKIKCKVASANFESNLFFDSEKPKEVEDLIKMKNRFWSDTIDFELSMWKNKWFDLPKIIKYFKANSESYESVSVSIDEAGHTIEQQIDDILIKWCISISIENWQIDEDEVCKKLIESRTIVSEQIKAEFSYKS